MKIVEASTNREIKLKTEIGFYICTFKKKKKNMFFVSETNDNDIMDNNSNVNTRIVRILSAINFEMSINSKLKFYCYSIVLKYKSRITIKSAFISESVI